MTPPANQRVRWTNGRLFVFTDGYRGWERVKTKNQPPKSPPPAENNFRWRAVKLREVWERHSKNGERVEVIACGVKFIVGASCSDGGFVALGSKGETVMIPRGKAGDTEVFCAERPIWQFSGDIEPHWRDKR